ncbi:MAG: LamB/YcsF family protein [Clostridia bacterium]
MGLKTAAEIFADRAYMEDLSLVPWKQSGAMITDEDLAVERCIKMIKEHKVTAITGKEIEIQGDTLCVPRRRGQGAGLCRADQKRIPAGGDPDQELLVTPRSACPHTADAEALPPSAGCGRWGLLSVNIGQMNAERTGFR